MSERPLRTAILSPAAEADIRQVLRWSAAQFGQGAAQRYAALLNQALRDLEADAERTGSRTDPALPPTVRLYHLASSRRRGSSGQVKRPRHLVAYRVEAESLAVVRVLHDSQDLVRHLPL